MIPTASFEIHHQPEYSVVRFFGHIDAGAVEKAKPALLQNIPATTPHLIIDLGRVEFLDSHGVGLFVSLLKQTHRNKGRLIITGADGQPAAVLDMVGFNATLVTYCVSVEEATRAL